LAGTLPPSLVELPADESLCPPLRVSPLYCGELRSRAGHSLGRFQLRRSIWIRAALACFLQQTDRTAHERGRAGRDM